MSESEFDIFDNVQYDTFYDPSTGTYEFEYTPDSEEIAWERACAAGTNPDEATPIYTAITLERLLANTNPPTSASNWEPPQKKKRPGIMNKWR